MSKDNNLSNILKYKYSGGFDNEDSNKSIGGDISNYYVSNFKQNIFNNVTEFDYNQGIIDYRCVYLENISKKRINNLSVVLDDVFKGATFNLGFNFKNDIQSITITGGDFVNNQTLTFSFKNRDFIVKYNTDINIFVKNFQKSINKIFNLKDVTVNGNYANGNSVLTVYFQGSSGYKQQPLIKVESYTLTPIPIIIIIKKQNGGPVNCIQEKLNNTLQYPSKIDFLDGGTKIEFVLLEVGDFLPIWLRRQVFSDIVPIENDGCSIITKALIEFKG
jgi:hypothetical protein